MKKLIIAAFAAMAMGAASAAAVGWNISTSDAMTDTDGVSWNGLAYIVCAEKNSQQAVLTALLGSATTATISGMSVASGTLTDGETGDNPISWESSTDYTAGDDYNFFFVLLDTEKKEAYIGDLASGTATEGYETPINPWTDQSEGPAMDSETFGDYGWYNVNDVPEPTSGLLLLLGMAGLALRRRRA